MKWFRISSMTRDTSLKSLRVSEGFFFHIFVRVEKKVNFNAKCWHRIKNSIRESKEACMLLL